MYMDCHFYLVPYFLREKYAQLVKLQRIIGEISAKGDFANVHLGISSLFTLKHLSLFD